MGLAQFWGGTQWLILIPLYFFARRSGFPLASHGILIAGMLGVLLNGLCFGLFEILAR